MISISLTFLLAQHPIGGIASWGIVEWIIAIIILCGIVGIAWIVLRVIGVSPPGWLIQILWIIVAVVVGILAIKFLSTLF